MGLHLLGYLYPSCFTWGFHALGFLPLHVFLIYLAFCVLIILHISKRDITPLIQNISTFMANKPYHFLGIISGIFIIIAIILRVKVPLLGDGFFLVKNFSEVFRDVSPLYPRNEPLATFYFYLISSFINPSTFNAFLLSFLLSDIILGIGFIITTFFIIRNLFTDSNDQFLAFCFVLVLPYMQLFFGYVETYGAVLAALSLFILMTILYLKQKISFISLPFYFLLLVLTHYLGLLLLPSLLYLSYIEYRSSRIKTIMKGYGILLVVVLILLIMINFDTKVFSAGVPHSHFLPLILSQDPIETYSEVYTLLSPFHILDIINFLALLSLSSFFFIAFSAFRDKKVLFQTDVSKFLTIAIIPVFLLLLIVKYDLGAAKDWDVLAPFWFLLALLAVFLFLKIKTADTIKIFTLILVITTINSFSYFILNATTQHSIQRYKSLLNKRVLSNFGYYASTLSLVLYYHQVKDSTGPIELWEEYTTVFPFDRKGYQNIVTNLQKFGIDSLNHIERTYLRWLENIPDDSIAYVEYSRLCLDGGNYFFQNQKLDDAKLYYLKAIYVDGNFERAYNNLGSVYAQEGKTDTAIVLYNRAIELDSLYSDPYFNLGNVYEDLGNTKKANEWFQKAAELGNQQAKDLLTQKSNLH